MITPKARGNALVFVLLLIAVIMLIVYAGTTLQPLEAKALDQHLQTLTHQALFDSAVEEALANLQAGRSPDFSRDLSINGQTARVATRQTRTTPDTIVLEIATQLPQPSDESRTTRATFMKAGATWCLQSVE